MRIVEIKKDLFELSPDVYYFAHCISGDYALGAGIARTFNSRMNMRHKLHEQYPIPKGKAYANVGKALLVDKTFNLVTKTYYYKKPTYDSLCETLLDMKQQCKKLGVQHLAMPYIGCGLDRLEWSKVRKMIYQVFEDMDIEVVVCYL